MQQLGQLISIFVNTQKSLALHDILNICTYSPQDQFEILTFFLFSQPYFKEI